MTSLDMRRKDEHLKFAAEFQRFEKNPGFDDMRFVHQVFPEVNMTDVDLTTEIAGYKLSHPFHINGMTGGSDLTKEYNEKIATLARETNTFMAVGSLSIALKDPSTHESFKVARKINPNGIIFANLGADKTLEDAKKACEIIGADGIQIHVNAGQEIIMPEGERNFEGWIENISTIIHGLGLPVLVKEVGFGMSKKAIKALKDIGAKTVDVSGFGGTSFAMIENYRRDEDDRFDFLLDFGNTTIESLLDAQDFIDDMEILASGGIRNSMDIVKALALGAKSVGMAGRILQLVHENELEDAIREVNRWENQIKSIMTLLGKRSIDKLKSTDIILENKARNWAELRGIEIKKLVNRE